jgi:hypothetical protein
MCRGLCRAIGWPVAGWSKRGKRKHSGAEAYRCLLYEDGVEQLAEVAGKVVTKHNVSATAPAQFTASSNGRLSGALF